MSVSQSVASDEQTRARYSSVLFIIMYVLRNESQPIRKLRNHRHRATSVDAAPREARLDQFLQPMINQWQDNGLSRSLSSFDYFSRLLGLGDLQRYLSSRAVHKVQDWSSHPLDDEGKALQTHMQSALDVSVPIEPHTVAL